MLVGLGLGTTFGRDLLSSAGVPPSCIRAIDHADRALTAGTAVADDGKAAVKGLRITEVSELLSDARLKSRDLFTQVKHFNASRTKCNGDRK